MKIIKTYPRIFALGVSAMVTFALFIGITLLTFKLIISYYPSESILPNGVKVKHEALAQLFISFIIAGVVSISFAVFLYKWLTKKLCT